jgi:hypothetical protein
MQQFLTHYVLDGLGILALIGAGWIVVRGQVTKQTIANLQDLVNSLQTKTEISDKEREELKMRLQVVEKENQILRELVTHESAIKELVTLTQANHQALLTAIEARKAA